MEQRREIIRASAIAFIDGTNLPIIPEMFADLYIEEFDKWWASMCTTILPSIPDFLLVFERNNALYT